jgi:hypothetical protein
MEIIRSLKRFVAREIFDYLYGDAWRPPACEAAS